MKIELIMKIGSLDRRKKRRRKIAAGGRGQNPSQSEWNSLSSLSLK